MSSIAANTSLAQATVAALEKTLDSSSEIWEFDELLLARLLIDALSSGQPHAYLSEHRQGRASLTDGDKLILVRGGDRIHIFLPPEKVRLVYAHYALQAMS